MEIYSQTDLMSEYENKPRSRNDINLPLQFRWYDAHNNAHEDNLFIPAPPCHDGGWMYATYART